MLKKLAHGGSYWRDTSSPNPYPELRGEVSVEIVIIGGGVTGMNTAYLLKEAGYKVAVVEKRTIGSGTTGRTTGKVTSQHNLIYTSLNERYGREVASHYGLANQAALEKIAKIVKNEKIECGFVREDNYVYTTDQSQVNRFKKEAKVASNLGLPATLETSSPLPFDIKAAVKFSNQAKFHSQKYLNGLAKIVDGNDSYIFENSNVFGIRGDNKPRIITKSGVVRAKKIIVATNVPTLPLMARASYCLYEYPMESYIVAGKPKVKIPGMYISPDKNHYSILPVSSGKDSLVLVGGESHISGIRINKSIHYKKLADYAQRYFGISEILYKWSDRDYQTYDDLPMVGKLYPWSRNLYVATAFRKWGLTNSMVAAMILRDEIVGTSNPWAKAFRANRLSSIAAIPRVAASYLSPS